MLNTTLEAATTTTTAATTATATAFSITQLFACICKHLFVS